MHISKVHTDVLNLILQHAAKEFSSSSNLAIWAYSLPLLWVSRNWRHFAIPHVFTLANVYSEFIEGEEQLDSNLQLIIDAQASQHLNSLHIITDANSNPDLAIKKIINCMATNRLGWNNVRTLMVEFSSNSRLAERDASALIRKVADMLPRITTLTVEGGSSEFTSLFGSLVNVYMPQLVELSARVPLHLPVPVLSPNLTKLKIAFPEDNLLTLTINAESLRYLELIDVQHDYNWGLFVDLCDIKDIMFSNLEKHIISYGVLEDAHNIPKLNYKLCRDCHFHFPKLKDLCLKHASSYCHVLRNGVFPSSLNSIDIVGTDGALASLAKQNIAQTNSLILEPEFFIFNEPTVPWATVSIDIIPSKICTNIKCELNMMNYFGNGFNIANLNWPQLTHLSLGTENANTIISIFNQFPMLEELYASLIIDNTYNNISVHQPTDKQLITPMSSKITKLKLRLANYDQSSDGIIFAKYLLLYLPYLSEFSLQGVSRRDLQNFVDNYKNLYPHLLNVSFL